MWFYTACVAVLAIAVAVIARALRGRRVDDHPICRRCRYDLSGTSQRPPRCPECGTDLDGERTVRIGNRQRQPVFALAGLAVLITAGTFLGLRMHDDLQAIDWQRVKPVWWLKRETDSRSMTTANAALTELRRRMISGEISDDARDDLVALALDRQEDRTRRWHSGWGDLIAVQLADGRLQRPDFDRFVRNFPGPMLIVRSPVRSGGLIPIGVGFDQREWHSVPDNTWLVPDMRIASITLNDQPRTVGDLDYVPGAGHAWRADLEPGTYTMTAQFDVFVRVFRNGPPANTWQYEPYLTWREDDSVQVEVLPADAPFLTPVRDGALVSRAQEAIDIANVTTWEFGPARDIALSMTLNIQNAPTNLAFQTFVRVGGREWPVGAFATEFNGVTPIQQNSGRMEGFPGPVDTVDIILRPSRDIAEVRFARGASYLDAEIVFENIAVTDHNPRQN